jgi:hypothetical protein
LFSLAHINLLFSVAFASSNLVFNFQIVNFKAGKLIPAKTYASHERQKSNPVSAAPMLECLLHQRDRKSNRCYFNESF